MRSRRRTCPILARSIDLRSAKHAKQPSPADRPGVMALAGALAPDVVGARISDRWDAEAYFRAVARAAIVSAIEEACGAEAATRAAKLKKGELVEVAVAAVVPTGWLPREIRWPGYAGPGAEQALAEAA